jgi:hypothetical protein
VEMRMLKYVLEGNTKNFEVRFNIDSACKAFFQKYNVNITGLAEKYSTSVASAYRDKIQGMNGY